MEVRNMNYRRIEGLRQTRLFITEVIIPVAGIIAAVDIAHPEYKYKLVNTFNNTKDNVLSKLKKRES